MARKPNGILGASTLFAAALAASTAFSQEAPAAKPLQNLPAIVVTTAVNRTLVDRVIGTGTVKPVEEVYIQPQVEGLSIRT